MRRGDRPAKAAQSASDRDGNLVLQTVSNRYRIAGEKAVADFTLRLDLDTGARASSQDVPREEDRLIEGLRAGAPDAYESLLQMYQQPVYNLVFRLMDDPSETPDVVQEVFLKVFRNIGAFRGNSSLKTWIYRIS